MKCYLPLGVNTVKSVFFSGSFISSIFYLQFAETPGWPEIIQYALSILITCVRYTRISFENKFLFPDANTPCSQYSTLRLSWSSTICNSLLRWSESLLFVYKYFVLNRQNLKKKYYNTYSTYTNFKIISKSDFNSIAEVKVQKG